jgi:hypothetical protein
MTQPDVTPDFVGVPYVHRTGGIINIKSSRRLGPSGLSSGDSRGIKELMKNLLNQINAQGALDSVDLHEDFISIWKTPISILHVHRALVSSYAVQSFVHLLCLLLHPKMNDPNPLASFGQIQDRGIALIVAFFLFVP